ncbi:MAG: hypothetical protein ACR2QM_07585 [Longimicrobiales bacterium]
MRLLPPPICRRLGVLGLATALLSCGLGESQEPQLTIRVAPTPPTVGDARVIVQLPEGGPQVTAVTVVGRAPNSDLPIVADGERSGPDLFAVPAFPFLAVGEWRLVAEATTASGEILRDSVGVRVVGGL